MVSPVVPDTAVGRTEPDWCRNIYMVARMNFDLDFEAQKKAIFVPH